MISSNRTGTADDQIVIVGAHYDTVTNTSGVDDNGSGVTALLQAAKNIGEQ
jgi:Zn-dependent M28 family amino/carboxypeptidase